jgi:hypothetical protein
MILIAPVVVAIIGLVVYVLTTGKATELGRIAFFCGLLVSLLVFAHHGLKVLP